tara:strand:+ start:10377 stop:11081 length:705 start_codon:yes stop_codon:yes gene_type:complete
MSLKTKNEEYNFFNKLSEEWWDENGKFSVLHRIRPLRIKYILDQLNDSKVKGLDVLDLGCGGGLVSEALSRLGANVTGIDFSENNIAVAKKHSHKNNLQINYINKNIENMEFTKKFDLIIMFEVLEHLDNWESFLYKVKKNLRKDGKLIISTINRNLISKYFAIFIAENLLKWIPKGTHSYEKFIMPEEIKTCMKSLNFKVKDLKGLNYNPISSNWSITNNTAINYFCTCYRSN